MFMLTDKVAIVVPSSEVTSLEEQDGSPLSLPIRRVGWALILVVKRLEREAESSPPYSAFLTYLAVVYICLHWQNGCLATYFLVQLWYVGPKVLYPVHYCAWDCPALRQCICAKIWDWHEESSVFSIVGVFLYRRVHAHLSPTIRACVLYCVPVWVQTNGRLIRSEESNSLAALWLAFTKEMECYFVAYSLWIHPFRERHLLEVVWRWHLKSHNFFLLWAKVTSNALHFSDGVCGRN